MSPVTRDRIRVPRPRYKAKHRALSRGGRVSKYHGHIFHPKLVFISATRTPLSLCLSLFSIIECGSLHTFLLIIYIFVVEYRTSISRKYLYNSRIGFTNRKMKLEKETEIDGRRETTPG